METIQKREVIRLDKAEKEFREEYRGRYQIVDSMVLGDDIICCVIDISSIACIPPYYHGHKVRVIKEDKMRDFL